MGGLLLAAWLVAALEGCATKTVAPAGVDQAPAASTATGAVQRFVWAMDHRDANMIGGLLTDDFQFVSAGVDSAGNPSGTGHDRTWMSAALAALVDSSSSVSLVLDQNLIPFPDSRAGRNSRYHKQLRSSIQLTIRGSVNLDVTGNAVIFTTRGDSAAIPAALISRGAKPDSTTWWLDRLEDETLASDGSVFATRPSQRITLTLVLEYFHSLIAR